MSSYVQEALMDGESLKYQAKVSWWSQLGSIVIGLLLMPFFLVGLLFWLAAFIRIWTTELAITDRRVIAKFGLISRSTVEISLKKVESIQVNQGILGRMLDYGTIIIAGAGNPQAPIPGISMPMMFRRKFLEIQEPDAAKS